MVDSAISVVCLAIIGALCTVGVFSDQFDDNLGQRIGMSLIALWCLARLPAKLLGDDTPVVHLVLHVGMAAYCIGVYVKVRRVQRLPDRRKKPPPEPQVHSPAPTR